MDLSESEQKWRELFFLGLWAHQNHFFRVKFMKRMPLCIGKWSKKPETTSKSWRLKRWRWSLETIRLVGKLQLAQLDAWCMPFQAFGFFREDQVRQNSLHFFLVVSMKRSTSRWSSWEVRFRLLFPKMCWHHQDKDEMFTPLTPQALWCLEPTLPSEDFGETTPAVNC